MCVCVNFFTFFNAFYFSYRIISNVFFVPLLFREFTNMPMGFHTFLDCVKAWLLATCASVLMRYAFNTIVPFEILVDAVVSLLLDEIFFNAQIIPVKDKRTGLTEKLPISTTTLSHSHIS